MKQNCVELGNREIVKSHRISCQIAVRKMGYSGADVARFLGIKTSAINCDARWPGLKRGLPHKSFVCCRFRLDYGSTLPIA
jgi:hypothetical protein